MQVKPLEIPEALRRPPSFCTIVGQASRIHHELRSQLLARDETVLRAWDGAAGADIAHHLRELAQKIVPWPNAFFIPNDPWGLIGWDGVDQMDEIELAQAAEEFIGRRLGRSTWLELGAATFGEVVAALDDARRLELGRPRRSLGQSLMRWTRLRNATRG